MKKIIKSICFLALSLMVLSCSKDDSATDINKNLEEASSVQSSVSAKKFIDSNEKLDIQIDQTDPEFAKKFSDTEVAKLKAAVYRFYSTVEVKDGIYSTTLERADQINISKDLFKLFKNNLDHMNQNINKQRAQGGKVTVQQVTPEYLESLLK